MKKYTILILLSLGCWVRIHAQTPKKVSYTYDALNRLTEVTYPNGEKITYNYDVLGNRTSVVQKGCTATPTAVISGGGTINSGETTDLTITFTGLPPYNFTLSSGYSGISPSPTQTIRTGPTVTTTYTLASVSNDCGAGTVSGSAVVTVNCNVPTGMLWSERLPTSFKPSWQGIAGYNYVVRYRILGATTWIETTPIPCITNGILVTTLSGLVSGTNYEWQVKAICSAGNESTYSASTFTSTLCQSPTLYTPVGPNITNNSTIINWSTFGIPLNANLRWRVLGVSTWNVINGLSGTTYTLTGLLSGTAYEVQVQTICADDNLSSFSSSVIFTTTGPPSNPCPPAIAHGTGILPAGTYQAGQTISSQATISTPTTYKAGESISFTNGFQAGPNVVFEAKIEGCPTAAPTKVGIKQDK